MTRQLTPTETGHVEVAEELLHFLRSSCAARASELAAAGSAAESEHWLAVSTRYQAYWRQQLDYSDAEAVARFTAECRRLLGELRGERG